MSGPRTAARRTRRARRLAAQREEWRNQVAAAQQSALREAEDWRSALARHACVHVYHWTPLANLRSILQHGLLSAAGLAQAGIEVRHKWGSGLGAMPPGDSSVSLSDYHRGIARTSGEPAVVLALSAETAIGATTRYRTSPDGPLTGGGPDALAAFDSLWTGETSPRLHNPVEVLVANRIPPDAIAEVWTRPENMTDVRSIVDNAGLKASPLVRPKPVEQGDQERASIYSMDIASILAGDVGVIGAGFADSRQRHEERRSLTDLGDRITREMETWTAGDGPPKNGDFRNQIIRWARQTEDFLSRHRGSLVFDFPDPDTLPTVPRWREIYVDYVRDLQRRLSDLDVQGEAART